MQKNNGGILKNIIKDKLQESFKLMLDSIKIRNHHVSIDNIYITGDLVLLVILLGKDISSPKWCSKCKLHPKVWLQYGHEISEYWTINTLSWLSESDSTGSTRLGVKEAPIWKLVEVDKYFFSILHNQINLGGNEYIENISTQQQVTRNSLSGIDASISEKYILRQDLDISDDGKRLNSHQNSRRNDSTLIINALESINDRESEIDELSRKRDVFSSDVNRIRKHKNNLKSILTEYRCNRNKTDRGLEDKLIRYFINII